MKRSICLILAALLLLGTLTGCAAQQSAAPQEELPAASRTTGRQNRERPATTVPPESAEPEASSEPEETPATDIDPQTLSPLMWKVTDGEGHCLYLFGTIHVGDRRNRTVLARVSDTLESCDALAVEFDLVAYQENSGAAMDDMAQYVLSDGSSIQDHMPPEMYESACALLEQAGLYPALFQRYNLAMWSQLVDSAAILVYGSLDTDCGMDELLIRHAYEKEIPVRDVESAAFQMSLLNSFDDELYLLLIEAALDSLEDYDGDLLELYESWLSGDRDRLWSMLSASEDEETEEQEYTEEQIRLIEDYNSKLLDERNLGMCEKAKEYLASGETVFFAVGAAHMADEMGLVQLLLDAGYSVEPYLY